MSSDLLGHLEARALDVADYTDGWLSVARAMKGRKRDAPIRGTKSGKAKRRPVAEDLKACAISRRTWDMLTCVLRAATPGSPTTH